MNGSPSTPTNPKTTCANCSRAAASHCLPCKNAAPYNGKIQLTKYCGPRCQKLHQITHRLLCHDLSERKAFYRACSLLSDIYFLYREFTLEYQVLKVGRKGWKLRVDLGDRKEVDKEQQEEEDIKVKVIISPLPLMEGSVQDKRAMLAALSGDGHISCFSTIVKTFLNSFDANIYIMTIPTTTPATPSPIVQIIDPAGSPHSTIPTHKVLHVAFDNGELYVLDLNSANFGTHNSLSTYSEYTRAHMGERGTLPAQLSPLNGDVSDLDMESLVTNVYLGIHMRIREVVNEWQIESGISVADMLRVVKVEEYENLKKDILMRCAKKLEWHMKRLGVKQIEDVVEWNGGA